MASSAARVAEGHRRKSCSDGVRSLEALTGIEVLDQADAVVSE